MLFHIGYIQQKHVYLHIGFINDKKYGGQLQSNNIMRKYTL